MDEENLEGTEIEIDIVDDTPEEDQGKQPLPPISDDELEKQRQEMDAYASKGVQERINKLTHHIHDERRAKEEAEAAERKRQADLEASFDKERWLRQLGGVVYEFDKENEFSRT